jgi:hypothetical protein
MEKININSKRQLLRAIGELKDDLGNLTLNEIVDKFTSDVNKIDKETEKKEQEVIQEFTDVYLRYFEQDKRIFGDQVNFFHIKELKTSSFTDQWERTYLLSGERFWFSKHDFNYREFDSSVYSVYTEKQLRKCVKITKDEYESYIKEYDYLTEKILKILYNK